MAEQEGFVKVDRNMLHWKWMTEPLTAHLFIVMLLKANYKDLQFKGKLIPKGSFVTSYQSLCNLSGLSVQECRTAIKRLKSTGEITNETSNQYQVITIVNYKQYQNLTSKLTSEQQATNKRATSEQQQVKNIKNIKKGRKEKNKEKSPSSTPLGGGGDVPRANMLKPIDEGTVDDIPAEYRDFCKTYQDYWRFCNR